MGCHCVAKIFLILFNVVLVVTGAILVTVGISIKQNVVNLQDAYVDTAFRYVPCMLIGVGIIAASLGILGFIAAIKEIKSLLIVFVFSLLIIFVLELVLGLLCVVFSDKLEDEISKAFKDTIKSYQEEHIMKTWDRMQSEMMCCGYDGYLDWSNFTESEFKDGSVPDSCCVYYAIGCGSTRGETIRMQGCKETILRVLEESVFMQGMLAACFGTFQIVGIIAAILLFTSRKTKGEYV